MGAELPGNCCRTGGILIIRVTRMTVSKTPEHASIRSFFCLLAIYPPISQSTPESIYRITPLGGREFDPDLHKQTMAILCKKK
jgi:hypothetical protein